MKPATILGLSTLVSLGGNLWLAARTEAQMELVPNPSFEEGDTAPTSWSLSGGVGGWVREAHTGQRGVSVTGTGTDSNYWRCDDLRLAPGQLYRLSFYARTSPEATGGTVISGPNVANRDFQVGTEWERRRFVFHTPTDTAEAYLRFGQWHKRGTVFFDDVELLRVTPLYRRVDSLELGTGERIYRGVYTAQPRFGGEGSNHARFLVSHTAGFNTNRWVMWDGTEVVYCHRVGDYAQTSAQVAVTIGYYVGGKLVVETSANGRNWTPVGEVQGKRTGRWEIPPMLLPARAVWIRLRATGSLDQRGNSHPGEFQIHRYEYIARLDGHPPEVEGDTRYLEVRLASPRVAVAVETLGRLRPGEEERALVRLTNPTAAARNLKVRLTLTMEEGEPRSFTAPVRLEPNQTRTVGLDYEIEQVGTGMAEVSVTERGRREPLYLARTDFQVPYLYAANYGYRLPGGEEGGLWWCEGTYKVSRERARPRREADAVYLSAARNEYEPFQLVLRPERDWLQVAVEVSDLRSERGRIGAENVSVCLVEYVRVTVPTDATGTPGLWPDPLPPVEGPFTVRAGQNQPLWITVYVPEETPAGDYEGTVTLRADGWEAQVPVRLHVWNFTLPHETHVRSAFGFSPGNVFRYHNLETEEERRQVVDLYLRNFAAHRICPYNPMPFDPIKVDFGGPPWRGGQIDRTTAAHGQQSLKVVDESPTSTATAVSTERIALEPGATYRFRWAAKTATEGQEYMVTLTTYDAQGQWIWGRNLDFTFAGSTDWRREEVIIPPDRFAPEARYVLVNLRGTRWTEKGERLGTTWFDEVSLVKLPAGENLVADGSFETRLEDLQPQIDFTDFDRAAEYAFEVLHFNTFRLPLVGLGGGTFHARYLGNIAGYQQGTPEHTRLFTEYARQLQAHLEEKGWLDKAFVYWFDEPEPKDYQFVAEGMRLIHQGAPKLKRMLTEQPEPELYGYVDIWCPVTPNYNFEIAEQRRAAGEDFWWYVCTGPKAPYCTLFIDHHAIEMRMWLWQTWKYKVHGVLVWQTNYWTSPTAFPDRLQNPWEDPMSYVTGYGREPGTIGYWGNGDGRFLYPPNRQVGESKEKYLTGPVNSLRWEMLREGIEDYEYFYLLQQAVARAEAAGRDDEAVREARALLTVPEEICRDMTHFTKDPQPLYAHRKRLARALERLETRPRPKAPT